MNRNVTFLLGLIVFFTLGFIFGRSNTLLPKTEGESSSTKPAYVIVSGKLPSAEKMAPYMEEAGPLAQKAGLEYLAQAESLEEIELLEGTWPYSGTLIIEQYPSMEALKSFWYSPEYQKAKKLREGVIDVDFVIALEAG